MEIQKEGLKPELILSQEEREKKSHKNHNNFW